jgi:TatD DNase family protein
MLIDTHCHLHLLEEPAAAILEQARAEGVGVVVDVGVDLPSSRQAVANARRFPGVVASAGVHPHDAVALTSQVEAELRELLADGRVVAVGETGLDYFRDHSPRELQRAAFAVHIRLAREFGRALVVHCRDAWEDVLALLAVEGAGGGDPGRVVLHCFSGDERIAARALEAGYTISFAGTVTFKNAAAQRAACAAVPLDRMVLETDSPFLSPHPFRGQPNRPWRVAVTAETVAEVHGVTPEEVAAATTATASRAFGLPAGPVDTANAPARNPIA